MPFQILIDTFGSTQARVAQEGPDYLGPEPTLSVPLYFSSSLEKAAAFSVENLSELNDARIWFADTTDNPEDVPSNALLLPMNGGVRDFPYQGDLYQGYLMGVWVASGGFAPGEQAVLTLNVIKTSHYCK